MNPTLPLPRVANRISLADRQASAWIEQINPLRNLSIAKAQMIFDAARNGNDVRLQWIYANMEQADPTLMICSERRSGALVDLDWTIRPKKSRVKNSNNDTLADEQCACLESAFANAEDNNLFPAIEHLATAFFRGHAHISPRWNADGTSLLGFECFDAWNFCRDILLNKWYWNPSASESIDFSRLQQIPENELCTLVRSRHVDYPAMSIYLRNALGEHAWGQFLERYGVPPVIITMPPELDPDKVEEYCAAAEKVADGGSGALPSGSLVSYANESRGVNPFSDYLAHQQELVVLMATGGMLTSLTGATGIGQGATSAHEETWRMIVRRDASSIATAINRTVTRQLLDRCFPGRPHLAQFDFETLPTPSASEIFDIATKAVSSGYKISQEELEQRTGFTLEIATPTALPFAMNKAPTATESMPAAESTATESTPAAESTAAESTPPEAPKKSTAAEIQALARALQIDLSPAASALQTFLEAPTPEAAKTLSRLLPSLLPDDPVSAELLETELATAYADAFQTATQS
ncbi:MAG: DUF935 family protein [Alistipes sp.]